MTVQRCRSGSSRASGQLDWVRAHTWCTGVLACMAGRSRSALIVAVVVLRASSRRPPLATRRPPLAVGVATRRVRPPILLAQQVVIVAFLLRYHLQI